MCKFREKPDFLSRNTMSYLDEGLTLFYELS